MKQVILFMIFILLSYDCSLDFRKELKKFEKDNS